MNLKKLINKSKKNHIYWIITFIVLILIAIFLIIYANLPYTNLSMLLLSMFLGFGGLIYFAERIINFKKLINYCGIDNLDYEQILIKCNEKFTYQSPDNAFCDHIYVNKEYIYIVNNDVLIIPKKEINEIVVSQQMKIINPKTFNISKWQNTFLLTTNRGLPDTIYCVYEVEIHINGKCLKSSLIKEVGENLLDFFNSNNIKYKLITINNFNDDIYRKKGMTKFKKDVIPGIIFLIVIMILIMIAFYLENKQ